MVLQYFVSLRYQWVAVLTRALYTVNCNKILYFLYYKLMLPLLLLIYGWLTAIKYDIARYNNVSIYKYFLLSKKNVSESNEYLILHTG